MLDDEVAIALHNVRMGRMHLEAIPHTGITYGDKVAKCVEEGMLRYEEVESAMRQGHKTRARNIARFIRRGLYGIFRPDGKTYREELKWLVDNGYAGQETLHDSLLIGRRNRAAKLIGHIESGHGKDYKEEIQELTAGGFIAWERDKPVLGKSSNTVERIYLNDNTPK